MTDATITHVKIDPTNQRQVEVIFEYGTNKPRAEEEFNIAYHNWRKETPIKVVTGRKQYLVFIEDGHLINEESFDASHKYTLILKGEIV